MSISQVVAAKASDGNNYDTVPPNVKGSGAGGNGGAVTRGGTVASGLLDNVNVSRTNTTVFGSTVLDNDWADEAVSAGTFAYNNQSPVAKRLTDELSGVANNILLSGASVPSNVRSIHKLETLRTRRYATAIRGGKFNEFTGEFDAGFPVVAVDTLATDNAANPSRTSPGQLTYKGGALLPVTNNDYKPKTG